MESNDLTRRGALLGLAWLVACATSKKKAVTAVSDDRLKTYEQYLSAWSAITDDERAERLRGSLSPNVVFYNPTQTQRGLAGVAGQCSAFQKRTPGGSFVVEEMLGFESHGIVRWRLLDAEGKPGAFDRYGFDYGYDVVEFNAEGRIESILMFVHTKGARLK